MTCWLCWYLSDREDARRLYRVCDVLLAGFAHGGRIYAAANW
jgi:hypothetical protein